MQRKYIIGIVCFLILWLFVELIAIFTSSRIFGICALVFLFYKLLRNIGIYALYPGCFNYIKAEYEVKGSQRIGNIIVHTLKDFLAFVHSVQNHHAHYLYPTALYKQISDMTIMLRKFQNTLSEDKQGLLANFENILNYLQSTQKLRKQDGTQIDILLKKFLCEPEAFKQELGRQNIGLLIDLSERMKERCQEYFRNIHNILIKFSIDEESGPVKKLFWRLYGEKLWEIRFAFISWEDRFVYNIFMVDGGGVELECVVIRGEKDKVLQTNKAVIICLPNGAYLQYFALDSHYIEMYLKMGYQIILWNYRGYGQSTGNPEIHISMQDALAVYKFCSQQLQLEIQIAHGYSIGGPAAINIALNNSSLKVLVTDRTFSNIAIIAESLSPYIRKLCKLVLWKDSQIHFCQIFLKSCVKCKILIWANNDQIISDSCSLKMGVMKYLLKNSNLNTNYHQFHNKNNNLYIMQESSQNYFSYNNDGQETTERSIFVQKSQENGEEFHKVVEQVKKDPLETLKINIQEFAYNLIYLKQRKIVYEEGKLSSQKDINPNPHYQNFSQNSFRQQQWNQQQNKEQEEEEEELISAKEAVKKFWQIFANIDGGGLRGCQVQSYIERYVKKVKPQKGSIEAVYNEFIGGQNVFDEEEEDTVSEQSLSASQFSHLIVHKVESFVMGLVTFGCIFGKHRTLQLNNNSTFDTLKEIVDEYLLVIHREKIKSKKSQDYNIIYEVLQSIKFYAYLIEQKKKTQTLKKIEETCFVVPTQSGHNGDITGLQMNYLHKLISEHCQ